MKRIGVRAYASWKCVRVLMHIVTALWTIAFVFPKLSAPQKEERIRAWALTLLARIGIKLTVVGEPPAHGPLLLAIFPEGTTSDGVSLLPFHANLLQAAIATNAPVLPVALRFTGASAACGRLTCAW